MKLCPTQDNSCLSTGNQAPVSSPEHRRSKPPVSSPSINFLLLADWKNHFQTLVCLPWPIVQLKHWQYCDSALPKPRDTSLWSTWAEETCRTTPYPNHPDFSSSVLTNGSLIASLEDFLKVFLCRSQTPFTIHEFKNIWENTFLKKIPVWGQNSLAVKANINWYECIYSHYLLHIEWISAHFTSEIQLCLNTG